MDIVNKTSQAVNEMMWFATNKDGGNNYMSDVYDPSQKMAAIAEKYKRIEAVLQELDGHDNLSDAQQDMIESALSFDPLA